MPGDISFDRRRAHSLVRRLLDLPPDEQSTFLERACGDDDALCAAVLRVLRDAEAPAGMLDAEMGLTDGLWEGLAEVAAKRETPLIVGARVGSYRIVGEIERGGMAVVYRAERVDGELTRDVALKVLKLGLDTEEVVRRFEQERQILADLEHPGIARLYDAGRTEDGRPYFVMELVEGMPIDRYCDEHQLSVDERLELFCAVVQAVEYAHRNLVVHRDLKPSNILVTEHGGRGATSISESQASASGNETATRPERQVKLLDFGIARLLDAEADGSAAAAPTRALVRMMTPEYASPEQVRGERVTTASDVYQLGVLLYELLTERRPHAPADGGVAALERAICAETPTRPSTMVSRASLRRRLRGDLDNIVLKALRKEPERRYRTADRLAQDVRRHLAGLPVSARADTWSYRSRKFFARHTVGASAATAMLVLVAGLTLFYTLQIQRERDQAQAAAERADRMSQFLIGLFRAAGPRESGGTEVSARELLDRGVEQISRRPEERPESQADLLHALGHTYLEMGAYDSAEPLLKRAFELQRRHLGPEHPEVAEILGDLGLLRQQQGEPTRAHELLQLAARILEGAGDAGAPELARVLNLLGQVHGALGEQEKARTTLERALTIESRVAGGDSAQAAMIEHSLAFLLQRMGDQEQAERLYLRALATFERAYGPDHSWVGTTLGNLANLRTGQGKLEGLEEMYRRSLAISERAFGRDSAWTGRELNLLGEFLTLTGRHDEAIAVLRRALEVLRTALRADHPGIAFPLATLGDAYLATGQLHQARESFAASVAVAETFPEAQQFDTALAHGLARLGRIELELGSENEAKTLLERAVPVWAGAPEAIDPQLAPALLDLTRWLVEQERCVEALPLLQRGARLELPSQSPWSPAGAELKRLLAEC